MPFFYKKSFLGHLARERLFTFTDCVAAQVPGARL